jgi:hypothetical protein
VRHCNQHQHCCKHKHHRSKHRIATTISIAQAQQATRARQTTHCNNCPACACRTTHTRQHAQHVQCDRHAHQICQVCSSMLSCMARYCAAALISPTGLAVCRGDLRLPTGLVAPPPAMMCCSLASLCNDLPQRFLPT